MHIGQFPCVIIAPDDVALISGNSEDRRKFIDTILAQLYPEYLQHLINYNKLLLQRNSVLKTSAEYNHFDEALLNTLDDLLIEKGQPVFEWRNRFLSAFLQSVKKEYETIAEKNDAIEIKYYSQLLNTCFADLLKENRQRDLYLQRTGCGIHKDDLEITMNGEPFKSVASQGQRKSLLFAMKLAEYYTLKLHKGFAPVLLLDDAFEKLDELRLQNLLKKVCCEDGQVFITDTHKERLRISFEKLNVKYQLIELH